MPGSDKCFKKEIKEKNVVRMRVGGGESNLMEGAQSRHQDADLEKKNIKKEKVLTDGYLEEEDSGQRK